ncbi:MAG: hypothetical protein ACJ74C_12645 [Gaiellaceae bacterium]
MILALPPPTALTVSPARLTLVAPASRRVELRNTGSERLRVEVARRQLAGRGANPWLTIRPASFVLRPGAGAALTLRARGAHASPGDHELRLLFTARPLNGYRVGIRLRLGVGLRVRVAGRIERSVDIKGLTVRKDRHARVLLLSLANRGNVTEQLAGRVAVTLIRKGRVISRLRAHTRHAVVFAGARTVIALRYSGHAHGNATAVATVALGPGVRRVERRYRLRL